MNKILLITSTALLSATSVLTHAQATHKRTVPTNTISPSAVTATVVSYGYVANAMQTMDLTLSLTNTDGEYADSIAITFPVGITPTGTPNLTFPTRVTGGGVESYSGIVSGQTITWGANTNDFWGGIAGKNLNFKIDVTVGNITGTKTANYHVSGDGYYQFNFSGDDNGTFTIAPKLPVDLRIVDFFVPPFSCYNQANETIRIWLRNDGTTANTGQTDLSYQVNGNSTVTESTTQTTAPNDTLKYVFSTTADFSALGAYTIVGSGLSAADGDFSNNQLQLNSYSFAQNNVPYSSGFERTPTNDLLNWYGDDYDSPYSWDTTTITPHTGTLCMRMLETSATTCEDYLFSSCVFLEKNKTYNLSYWKNMAQGYKGSFGAYLAYAQDASTIIKTLTPVDTVPATGLWINDSTNFTVTSNGVYHLAFLALNYAQEVIALRIDDVHLTDVSALVALEQVAQNIGITVYPNPATDNITVLCTNNVANITLYNALGQLLITQPVNGVSKNTISTANLSNGYYTVKVTTANNNSTYKHVVIQK